MAAQQLAGQTIENTPWGGTKSLSTKQVTLQIIGSDETFKLALPAHTKVVEVRAIICQKLGVGEGSFQFVQKNLSSNRFMRLSEEIRSHMYVKGIKSWTRPKQRWPHPFMIVGGGHSGLRQAINFVHNGTKDFVLYEKWHRVGGTAWLHNANKTSKLQTEVGVYHLDYHPDWPAPTNIRGKTIETQPSATRLIEHFEQVLEEHGATPHIVLNTEVLSMEIVKDVNDPMQWMQSYHMLTQRYNDTDADENAVECSAVICYPGGLVAPRRIEYKGEENFEGQIGYGMFSEFNYDKVRDERVVIIGMGAFGTENVRTCVEMGAEKMFILCRRKTLAMPRIVSWHTNQSLIPVNGSEVFDMMKPMYDLMNQGQGEDPWAYYAVIANAQRTVVTVRQRARFGIGDVFFLASHFGKLEVIVDDVKRLKNNQIQLESGDRIEDVNHIVKVLGFQADWTTDKLMQIKRMEGYHVNGDLRRFCCSESPGIDAGKFSGTSFSPGGIMWTDIATYFLNFPTDGTQVLGMGFLQSQKEGPEGYPCYIWPTRAAGGHLMIYGSIPGLMELTINYPQWMRNRQLEMHPPEKTVRELEAEWKNYARLMKKENEAPDRKSVV